MRIKDGGGEFALIDKLSAVIPTDHVDLIAGLGDDAAVIRPESEASPYLLVTTDILIEDFHFRRRWARPEQIGVKAAECNLSDIAAMGGKPTWMFISLALTKDVDMAWAQHLYSGIGLSCSRHGIIVAGGDTTQSTVNTINITLMGTVSEKHLCLRSHARPGDILMVTDNLGASAAALALLEQDKSPSDYLLDKHLSPTSRLDIVETVAPMANAMIDISDGLGSEVHHICDQSDVGAVVYADAVPYHTDVEAAGIELGIEPINFALSGGEDYELLFSIAADKAPKLAKTGNTFYTVGKITEKGAGRILVDSGAEHPLPAGYNHFQ